MHKKLHRSALTMAVLLACQSTFAETSPEESDNSLDLIVVTASGTQTSVAEAPASISLIGQEEITKQPIKDLVDVLETLPGVINSPTSGGRNAIYIRGLDEDYVLRLVNGKRVSSSNGIWRSNNFDNTSIPLQFIERVEVIRGPMSALYGSDAVGGVVNVITKKPSEDWQSHLSFDKGIQQQGSGGDRDRTALLTSGKLNETLGLTFSAEKAQQDAWYYAPISDSTDHTLIEPRESVKFATTLDWQLSAGQSLSVDLAHDQDEVPLASYGYAQYQQEIDRWTYGLTWNGDWDWGRSEVLVNRSDAEMMDYNSRYVDLPQTARNEQFLHPDEKFTTLRGTTYFDLGAHTVTAGVEYLETEVSDDIQYPVSGGASVTLTSLFLEDQIEITDKLTATLGGRAEDAEIYGSHFSPRSYLVYAAGEGVTIKGGVGTAFRAPTLFQASPLFQSISCGGGCFIYGNPDLKEETSVNTELSVLVARDTWNTGITLFNNKVDELMEVGFYPTGHPKAGNRGYFNIDEATLRGVELSLFWRLNDLVSVDTNYTYMDARDGTDTRLDNRPRHKAYLRLNLDLTDNLNLYTAYNYYGAQPISWMADKEQDAYGIADIGGRYDFNDNFSVKLGMTNLDGTQPRDKDAGSPLYLQGRAIFAGLEASF